MGKYQHEFIDTINTLLPIDALGRNGSTGNSLWAI